MRRSLKSALLLRALAFYDICSSESEIVNSYFSLTFLISRAFASRHVVDVLSLSPSLPPSCYSVRMFQSASTSEAEYIIGHGKGSPSLLRNLYLTVDAVIGHDFALPYALRFDGTGAITVCKKFSFGSPPIQIFPRARPQKSQR